MTDQEKLEEAEKIIDRSFIKDEAGELIDEEGDND